MGVLRTRGSLLIVTLWIMTILSVLAVTIARYLSIEVRLAKYRRARTEAKALARSGVYLAMQRLQDDLLDDAQDWMRDDWAYFEDNPEDPATWVVDRSSETAGVRTIAIRIVDEERKLPLNRVRDDEAAADLVYGALDTLLGSSQLAAGIVDFIDVDNVPYDPGGVESDLMASPPYYAKNHAVVSHEELLEVADMDVAFEALQAYTSVAPFTKLNLNTVDRAVFIAMGFRELVADALTECRDAEIVFDDANPLAVETACPDMEGMVAEEENLLTEQFGVTSQSFVVVSSGRIKDPPVEATVEARLERTEGDRLPRILAWRDR